MREILNEYLKLEDKIYESFNIHGLPLLPLLDQYWIWDDHGLEYGSSENKMDYSPETINFVKEVDGFSCFWGYDNGNKFYLILDNNKKIEWD